MKLVDRMSDIIWKGMTLDLEVPAIIRFLCIMITLTILAQFIVMLPALVLLPMGFRFVSFALYESIAIFVLAFSVIGMIRNWSKYSKKEKKK